MRVCLACRNTQKAEAARQLLMEGHPYHKVDVLQVDVSCVSSVKAAAVEIQRRCVDHLTLHHNHVTSRDHCCRYKCVDWLFFNAGLMPVSGVNWGAFWPPTPR